MNKKLKVYVAGPYTLGDSIINIRKAIDVGNTILAMGHTPFVPHLDMLWHLVYPHPAQVWYNWDLEWLTVCDALIRLPGESLGADHEVARAQQLGLPVYTIEEFYEQYSNEKH